MVVTDFKRLGMSWILSASYGGRHIVLNLKWLNIKLVREVKIKYHFVHQSQRVSFEILQLVSISIW